MISLYYYPSNASLMVHMLLRELEAEFELRLVDRTRDGQKDPEYLRLNPHGRIPTLVDGSLVLYETAAIALYLVEKFRAPGLAPPVGSEDWAHFLKWMVYLTNTPQAEFLVFFYPHEHVLDQQAAATVKAAAERRLNGMFDRIAAELGEGPWLLGERFSAADLFLFMLVRWGRGLTRPARTLPAISAHAARVLARPAVQAALAAEGLASPVY